MRVRDKILSVLREGGCLRQCDIARALGASRSYVSEVLRKLVSEGAVERIVEGGVVKYRVRAPESFRGRTLKLGIVWASEYPFTALFAKLAERKLGLRIKVLVYPSALEATISCITGETQLVLSPLPTQFLLASLTRSLIIIGGGASGGAWVYENPFAREEKALSSMASSMEVMLRIALGTGIRIEYASSGEELLRKTLLGRARYVAVWEPLATRIEMHGMKKITGMNELGIPHCCTLAASRSLGEELLRNLSRIYAESLEEYKKKPMAHLEWYSALTGIPVDLLKKTVQSYMVEEEVGVWEAVRFMDKAGIKIPSPAMLREFVLRN